MACDQIEMFSATPPPPPPAKRTRVASIKAVEANRPKAYSKKTIEERFAEFDRAHPEVRVELRRLALELLGEGRRRISIKQLFEVARHNLRASTDVEEGGYRLNNSFTSMYSRVLVEEVPALASLVEMRELRPRRVRA
jgi:hypothetical protein